MATPAQNKNRYILRTVSLLFLFLLSLFFFSKQALEPKLTIYRDLFSENPIVSSLNTYTRSGLIPSSSNPELDDNAIALIDNEGPSSSTEVSITSNSNLDHEISGNSTVHDAKDVRSEASISSNSRTGDETNGTTVASVDLGGLETVNDMSSSSNSQSGAPDSVERMRENDSVSDDDSRDSLQWQSCDFYQGTWVRDEGYPLYRPGSCPYVDEAFDCQSNGRPDSEYLKWRWKPDGCNLPRFNATDFLVRLRGKRLMLVGDSMNRNQFESILCLLREGLENKSKMYEVHGYKITKGRGYYIFKFEDYNCTVEFVRSHFLVREGIRVNAQGNSNPTLSIDRIDKSAPRWKRADILIFNTAHWWTHGKTARGKNYYKEGDYIYPRFDAVEAYRRALKTWSKWIDEKLPRGKLVMYRGYSSAHFRGGEWDSGGTCNGEKEPATSGTILDSYPLKMKIVEEVIRDMKVPVLLLNITKLTNFRKDGHPSVYGKNVTTAGRKVSTRRQDCSHWCLPGIPDAWNELIYATLVARQTSANH